MQAFMEGFLRPTYYGPELDTSAASSLACRVAATMSALRMRSRAFSFAATRARWVARDLDAAVRFRTVALRDTDRLSRLVAVAGLDTPSGHTSVVTFTDAMAVPCLRTRASAVNPAPARVTRSISTSVNRTVTDEARTSLELSVSGQTRALTRGCPAAAGAPGSIATTSATSTITSVCRA
ncbi:hypothetical protein ASG76_04330 [Nocardioides sp. Soil774]|nr:hypothetical protein ASG76_04330 [Nocardioides sp. Soil774]